MTFEYPQPALYIAGRWIERADNRDTKPVVAPSTGASLADLPMANRADLDEALDAAGRAFPLWRRVPPYDRGRILKRVGEIIRSQRDLFAHTIAHELGKPLAEGLREADIAAEMFEWAAEECRRAYGRLIPARSSGQSLQAIWEPIGPIAAFSPWNAPAISPARKISGALAAGCSIVIKAAEETPGAAVLIVRAAEKAGVAPGALNLVFGDPAAISARLIDSPVIQAITFTGSTEVGRTLASQAAKGLKRMTMELGGHAPVLVFDDVDVEKLAAAAAAAKYRNSGQICTSPTRFYVHHQVYPRFLARFVEVARAWRIGDPLDADTQMGPVANSRRMDVMSRLTEDARTHGVEIAAGGERRVGSGFFWSPTVLAGENIKCAAATEEPFGPLALITPFSDTEDALAKANSLPQALAAYAFTHDSRIQGVLRDELNSGALSINHWQALWPETPFGGRGASGFGVEGGVEGLQAFQQIKFVSIS